MPRKVSALGKALFLHSMTELTDLENEARSYMSDQQLLFANEILAGVSPPEAYKSAGYTAKTTNVASAGSSRLLKSVNIERYLLIRKHIAQQVAGYTRDWAISQQIRLAEKAEKDGEYAAARACIAEVSKLFDHYPAQQIDHNFKGGVTLTAVAQADWASLLGHDPGELLEHEPDS